NGIDLRDQHFGRSSTSAPDGLTDFRLDGFAGLLLRSHSNEVSPFTLTGRDADRTRGTRRPHLSTGSPLWFSPRLTRPRAERVVLGVVARPVQPSPVYCGDHRR